MAETDRIGMLIPSLKCVNWGARLLVVGFAAGQIEKVGNVQMGFTECQIPANLLLVKSASIVGVYWGGTASM